ncbi:MAG TPA: hypothetical protein VFU73_07395 [Actinocrinis sp.]|nr:hypothetical protein [Actinocrinis sp.]
MRPMLKPALSRIWHDGRTLQLGHGPGTGHRYRLTAPVRALIDALDGTRDTEGLVGYAQRIGLDRTDALELLDRLAADGCLDDAALDTSVLAALSPAERGRLDPDLSGLGLRHRLPGGAVRALGRRRRASVAVYGLGRVGAQTAVRLAATGLGTVVPIDPSPVEAADTGPGAHADSDVGARRQDSVIRAIRLTAPSTATAPPPHGRGPDLAIVAPGERPPAELLAELAAHGVPHLRVEVLEDRALLGPLVVPGATPCARCRDLALTDRDPLWPGVLARLGGQGGPSSAPQPACDTVLSAIAAGYAVLHALAFLDGYTPPSVAGVVEFALPYAVPERTVVASHPACGCTGAGAGHGAGPTAGHGSGPPRRESAAPGSVPARTQLQSDLAEWTM